MSNITFDLTKADDKQLQAAALFDADAVAAERERRSVFNSDSEMFSAFAQAEVDIRARLAVMVKSPSSDLLRSSGIIDILRRAVITAKRNGIEIDEPTVPVITPPVQRKKSEPAPAPEPEAKDGGLFAAGRRLIGA